MKGKPLLVAIAAFVIVLFGGVAIAGVGALNESRSSDTASATHIEPVADQPIEDDKPAEPAKEEPKDEKPAEPAKEEPKDEKPAKEEPKDDEKEHDVPKDLFSITTPKDGAHVEKKVVRFAGEAADGVTVHRGKYKAASKGGEWALELVLSPGKNKVTFEAVHPSGATEVETVTVWYDAPKDEEPKEDPKDVAFTANQKYGSCGEEVPYDKFWGTAQPGSTITVSSPYGSGSTTASEKGKWDLKVKFPTAPVGKTFEVTVTSSSGGSKTFTFTNTGSGKDH